MPRPLRNGVTAVASARISCSSGALGGAWKRNSSRQTGVITSRSTIPAGTTAISAAAGRLRCAARKTLPNAP
jgi:hypothetical protein